MADRAVDLPKPHPDDAEDVVDWLSTARALWARGEKADALVWLRRAAEAAAMCGQPFRASEIGMYVTALEETFGELPTPPDRPPPKEGDRPPQDTLVDTAEAFGQLAGEVLRNKMASIEVDVDEDTLIEESPAGLLATGAALGPAMVARVAPPGAAPVPRPPAPPPPPPPSREVHPPKVVVQVASAPPVSAAPATAPSAGSSARPPARQSSVPPPPGFVQPLAPPRGDDGEETTLVTGALRGVVSKMLGGGTTVPFGASPLATTPSPPATRSTPPGAGSQASQSGSPPPTFGLPPMAVPRPPPTPQGEAFSAFRDSALAGPPKPSSAPPPPPSNQSSRPPPPAPSGSGTLPPPRSAMASSSGFGTPSSQRKMTSRRPASRAPRQPILDPWAEEEVARAKPVPPAPKSGTEEVVVVRARFPSMHDEEDVFTSAAPLPVALRRSPPAAPPAAPPPPAPSAPRSVAPPAASPQAGGASQPGRLANAADVATKSVPPPARVSRPPESIEPELEPEPDSERTEPQMPAAEAKPAAVSEPKTSLPQDSPSKPSAKVELPQDSPSKPSAKVELPQDSPSKPSTKLDVPRPGASVAPSIPRPSARPPAEAPASRIPSPLASKPGVLKSVPPAKVTSGSSPPPAKVAASSPPAAAAVSSPPASAASSPPASIATSPASAASSPPANVAPSSPPPAKGTMPPAAKVAPSVLTSVKAAPSSPPAAKPSVAAPSASAPPAPSAAPPAAKARPATVPPPPPAAPAPADEPVEARSASFDPARATLPMMLEIEPRPVDVPSMRATIPMGLELPKEIEAFFEAQEAAPVLVEGVRLDEVDTFEGLPRPVLEMLAEKAEVVELAADEEVGGFGAALLLSGSAVLCATIVDAAAHWASPRELLVARGSLADGIAVRVVGAAAGAKVAVWPRALMDEVLAAHAAVQARARARGDRLQALAGATMGPFGEIEDDHRRALAADLAVRCLAPGEIWLEDGAPAPAIVLVGAGEMELYGPISEETSEAIEPGGLVFPELCGLGGEAPSSARAGAGGALLLIAARDAAERMSARVPDLAKRLRGES